MTDRNEARTTEAFVSNGNGHDEHHLLHLHGPTRGESLSGVSDFRLLATVVLTIRRHLKQMLAHDFGVSHSTLEFEFTDSPDGCGPGII